MGGTIIPITSYFGVQLCVGNPNKKEEDLKELKLAGSLEMCETGQGVEPNKLRGQIYDFAAAPPEIGGEKRTGMIKYSSWDKGWNFGTEKMTCFNGSIDPNDDVDSICYDFYTVGDAPGLILKALIKIPSKMVSSSGSVLTWEPSPSSHFSANQTSWTSVSNVEKRCFPVIRCFWPTSKDIN